MLTFSTFVTGLQEPIAQWIAEDGHRPRQILDGAILYDARKEKRTLPCFFNTFNVLDFEKRSGSKAVEQLMRGVLQRGFRLPDTSHSKRSRGSFRVVTSHENQLVAVDKRLRSDVEKLIASRTGMIPDRRGGGREFWFLARSEGVVLFMERQQAKNEKNEQKLKKGELRPQLAYCLNRLAQPIPEDIMVDPFCGYGAITRARAAYFPYREIYGLDIDGQKIKALQQQLQRPGVSKKLVNSITAKNFINPINYQRADIRQLSAIFPAQSVDVIITDPPWGVFDTQDDIPSLYENLAKVCKHVIKPDGRMVILTAQKEQLQKWQPDARYDILVSGQKAAVFVFTYVNAD